MLVKFERMNMMNKKAQIFLDYLQAKNVTCFQMQ